jgi:asparagine synthase (glutamine-hydrolysing)
VQRPVLEDMLSVIRHRGPDQEGIEVDGSIGLAHARLSIIDLVSGGQPMTSDDVTVVFNGEIYNYVELRQELIALGHSFRTTSDTEVLLRMYQQYGPDFVKSLNGMFAFVLVDRGNRRAMAARDHFGIKPLYWHRTPDRLLFASEIKALLQHPDVAARPDQVALEDYLTFQYVLGQETLFQDIHKVEPGHYHLINLDDLSVVTQRYWRLDFHVDAHHTEEYFVDRLRYLLEDSVRLQMRSDVPVGAHLSGGTDSSLVVMLASRAYGGTLKTFTGAFDEGPAFDERPYARKVVEAAGAQGFEVTPTEEDFIDLLPKLVWHMDEPAAGPGLFPQYVVSRLARDQVKVVLGGQGGDEIFGGYARYVVAYLEQAIKGAILETADEGEHIVSLNTILPNLPYLRQYLPMMRTFWSQGAFESMDRRYFALVDRSRGMLDAFSQDFVHTLDTDRTFGRFQCVFNDPETKSYFNRMTHFDMVASLPALLHVEDRVSMANSLESRVPLLDHRVAETVASMPPVMKFRGGEAKYILKRSARGMLPDEVLDRRDKMGFPVPLHLWARNRARDFFADVLLSSRCRERGLFDPLAVERLLDREEAFGRLLWGLLNIELWFRTFIDRR